MKSNATPAQMEDRRRDRLGHLTTFMRPTMPPAIRDTIARDTCLNLLSGWFYNSKWAVVRYVFFKALAESWEQFVWNAQLFWHHRIMRRTREEAARRVFGDDEVDEALEDEWPAEVEL